MNNIVKGDIITINVGQSVLSKYIADKTIDVMVLKVYTYYTIVSINKSLPIGLVLYPLFIRDHGLDFSFIGMRAITINNSLIISKKRNPDDFKTKSFLYGREIDMENKSLPPVEKRSFEFL